MSISVIKVFEPVEKFETMIYVPQADEVEFSHRPVKKIVTSTKGVRVLEDYLKWFRSWFLLDIKNDKWYMVGGSEKNIKLCKRYFEQFQKLMKRCITHDDKKGLLFLRAYEIQFSGEDYVSREELLHERWNIDEDHICGDQYISLADLIIYRTTDLEEREAFCILYPAHHTKENLAKRVKGWVKEKSEFCVDSRVVENIDDYLLEKGRTEDANDSLNLERILYCLLNPYGPYPTRKKI